jgi:hypothetical protein
MWSLKYQFTNNGTLKRSLYANLWLIVTMNVIFNPLDLFSQSINSIAPWLGLCISPAIYNPIALYYFSIHPLTVSALYMNTKTQDAQATKDRVHHNNGKHLGQCRISPVRC